MSYSYGKKKISLFVSGKPVAGPVFEYKRNSKLSLDLDEFSGKIPKDTRAHIELRTEAYWVIPVFDVLENHGVGLVFSHWTWLPLLRKQFAKVNKMLSNSGRQVVIRLMTPLRMSCEDSYAKAFPLTKWSASCWTRK